MVLVKVAWIPDFEQFESLACIAGFGWYGSRIGRFSRTGTPKMAKKASKSPKQTAATTKSQQIMDLLKRANGASITELVKATGWQEHSVRGFMSGTLKKKLALEIVSTRDDGKGRRYQIMSQGRAVS